MPNIPPPNLRYIHSHEPSVPYSSCKSKICAINTAIANTEPPATINGTANEIPLNKARFNSVLSGNLLGLSSVCATRAAPVPFLPASNASLRMRSACLIGSATAVSTRGIPSNRSISLIDTSVAKTQATASFNCAAVKRSSMPFAPCFST